MCIYFRRTFSLAFSFCDSRSAFSFSICVCQDFKPLHQKKIFSFFQSENRYQYRFSTYSHARQFKQSNEKRSSKQEKKNFRSSHSDLTNNNAKREIPVKKMENRKSRLLFTVRQQSKCKSYSAKVKCLSQGARFVALHNVDRITVRIIFHSFPPIAWINA